MRRDLVQERDRRRSRHVGDEPRVGEHQPDQQRLLFAGRGARGGASLGPCQTTRSPTCGPTSVRPCGGVAAAIVAQDGAVAVLGIQCRACGDQGLDLALEARASPRERATHRRGRRRSAPRAGSRIRAAPRRPRRRARPPRARSRRAKRRYERVAAAFFEQAVAPAQRPLELSDPRSHGSGRSPARSGRGTAAARSPGPRTANPSKASARRRGRGR